MQTLNKNPPLQSMYGLGPIPIHGNKHHHIDAKK